MCTCMGCNVTHMSVYMYMYVLTAVTCMYVLCMYVLSLLLHVCANAAVTCMC